MEENLHLQWMLDSEQKVMKQKVMKALHNRM